MANVPTPHNSAKLGDIAKTVLMPGDPLRAKFIADNFLTDVIQYNTTRNMFGFTGYYNGKRVSVQGSGMGMPSIGIYSYELFHFYDVDTIIRVGTAGAIADELEIGDVCFGMAAATNSNYLAQYALPGTYAPVADFELLVKGVEAAKKLGCRYSVGELFSSDVFYSDQENSLVPWRKMNVLCTEMEAAALYANANAAHKKALAICTISDCPFKHVETDAETRQNAFTNMMKIALEIAE